MNSFEKSQAQKILSMYNSENNIEKAKAFPIGSLDKSGRNIKTANGWEPVKKQKQQASTVESKENTLKEKPYLDMIARDANSYEELSSKTVFYKEDGSWLTAINNDSPDLDSAKKLTDKNKESNNKNYNIQAKYKESFDKLPKAGTKDNVIYVLKAGVVTAKNIENNEYVQAWGENTSYFLVADKYIIAGYGKPEGYIDTSLNIRLADDGNKTTKFDNAYPARNNYKFTKYTVRERKVSVFADNVKDFAALLPKGKSFTLYTMK